MMDHRSDAFDLFGQIMVMFWTHAPAQVHFWTWLAGNTTPVDEGEMLFTRSYVLQVACHGQCCWQHWLCYHQGLHCIGPSSPGPKDTALGSACSGGFVGAETRESPDTQPASWGESHLQARLGAKQGPDRVSPGVSKDGNVNTKAVIVWLPKRTTVLVLYIYTVCVIYIYIMIYTFICLYISCTGTCLGTPLL